MCNVLDKIEARGEVRGEVKAYSNMGKSAEEIATIMNKPVEVIKDIIMSFAPQPSEVKEKLYLYMDESSAPYDLYESTPEDDLFDEMIIEKYHLSSGENDP